MARRRVRKGRSKRKFKKKVRKIFKKMMKKRRMKKQRRARSSGAPKKDIGIGAQLFEKKQSTLFKSRLSQTGRLLKEVKANEKTFSQEIRAIQPYRNQTVRPLNYLGTIGSPELGGGAHWLYNCFMPEVNRTYVPCYTVDLTSCQNIYLEPTTNTYQLVNYNPIKRLAFTTTGVNVPATDVLWEDQGSYLRDGVTPTADGWQTLTNSTLPGQHRIYPSDKCMLRRTEIDLFFYGAAAYATEFCIQIIKLKDDWLAPEVMQSTTPNGDYRRSQITFWDWYVKQFASHPLAALPSQASHMKVLAEKKFTLQPVSTSEGVYTLGNFQYPVSTVQSTANYGLGGLIGPTESIGHNQRVKMTLPWNKACNFNWQQQGNDLAGFDKASSTAIQIAQATGTVRPKERIYLTIRALNPVTSTLIGAGAPYSPGISTGNTPSFDIKLKNTFAQIS